VAGESYYALIASLPRLEHFERAEFLPITWQQLDSRLRGLTPDHLRQIEAAESIMLWHRQPRGRTTRQLADRYSRAFKEITDPCLKDLAEYRMGLRSVVIALRMRRRGEAPVAGEPWSVGRWTVPIGTHWDAADFGLGAVFPWIDQARRCIETGDAMRLERLLLDATWQRLSAIEGLSSFGFERVIAYVFKWDIAKRWLSYDAEQATERFQSLITEVIRDHEQLFA
jgi:hypothetical protein